LGIRASIRARWVVLGALAVMTNAVIAKPVLSGPIQEHWAFESPRRSALPAVRNKAWPRNAVDHFILARLEQEGLKPALEAQGESLICRTALDLTGLPPAGELVRTFLGDRRPDRFERVVAELMATRAYAERQAQDWLDLARYADSNGYADDQTRDIWPYREWVIDAIAGNQPFDQFTIEQLAGDMLPGATTEQRIASAFHRNAPQAKGNTYPVEEYRHLANPSGVSRSARREQLDLLRWMNQRQHEALRDPEIISRMASYEMAFRMQSSVPELTDLRQEPEHVLKLYGAEPGKPSFANNCLLARRLIEKGVRFVQLYDRGWDSHTDIEREHSRQCAAADRPSAALITDVKQRGLLEDTLVIWGGEFGRTPVAQVSGKTYGRDHHPHGFTVWLAGGGVKPGITYGATDEFGYHVAERPVHVHDLHATILHLLGIDHERLTFRTQGRDFRLADVAGNLVKDIVA
jgi:hypothetical protein